MALPTVADVKAYLRIETAAEDTLLTSLLARAIAAVETYLGRPIEVTAGRTFESSTSGVTDGWSVSRSVRYGGSGSVANTTAAADIADAVTVTALATHPDFTTRISAIVNGIILDTVSSWYRQRDPHVSNESAGGGISFTYSGRGLPPDAEMLLAPFRLAS